MRLDRPVDGRSLVDLNAIEALLAIAESGTVAATARQLDISRASVRRRLDALEADVGAILMHRGDGPVRLTPAGRLLAERGATLLRQARAAAHDARLAAQKPDGVVRFISPTGAPAEVRARTLMAIGQLHPGLRFDIIDAEDPLAHLDDGFDLLLYFGAAIEDGAFFIRSVARVPLGLMASPGYLERYGTPRTIDDLADHRLLVWREPRGDPDALPGLDGQHHPIRPALVSGDMELIREMATEGGGIAWGGTAPLGPNDERRTLMPVLPDLLGAAVGVWLLCPLPSTLDPRVRAMVEGVLELLQAIDLG